ncbi:MAG: riboflavin synthase [Mucinivorans sp.]
MFSGIVQSVALVEKLNRQGTNLNITLRSKLTPELHIDQSVAHNGVCLTVVDIAEQCYTVTAIAETLLKSNLGELSVGDQVNLERSMRADGMLDGHIVQGHVDTTAICRNIEHQQGSWYYTFEHEAKKEFQTVEKGSVCVNGVSLTVVNSRENSFQVAIIPYTYENTNFHCFEVGSRVNLEFDILGKYILKYMTIYGAK